jgi:hypothetical protein
MTYLGTYPISHYEGYNTQQIIGRVADAYVIFSHRELAYDCISHFLIYRDFDYQRKETYYDVIQVDKCVNRQDEEAYFTEFIKDYLEYRAELLRTNRVHELRPNTEINFREEN